MGFPTIQFSFPLFFLSFLRIAKLKTPFFLSFMMEPSTKTKRAKTKTKKKRREKHIFFNFLLILFYLDILHNTCLRGGIPTYTIFIPTYTIFIPTFFFFYEDCKIEGISLLSSPFVPFHDGTINQDKKNKKKRRKEGCVFFFFLLFLFYFI